MKSFSELTRSEMRRLIGRLVGRQCINVPRGHLGAVLVPLSDLTDAELDHLFRSAS